MPKVETNTTPVCSECPGRCCTRRRWVFSYAALTMREAGLPLFAPHVQWRQNADDHKRQLPWLPLDPKCPFLQKDNRCGIYDDRPDACRGYVCYASPDTEEHIKQYPTHRRLLNRWKVLPGQEYGIEQHGTEQSD